MNNIQQTIHASNNADWGQVVANGGPPCFHVEGGRFCFRAQRWEGHDCMHRFVPLRDVLESLIAAAREACAKVCEKRAENRFAEHGTIESDTGAGYYQGSQADFYETQDEEDESCAADIRARATPTAEEREA